MPRWEHVNLAGQKFGTLTVKVFNSGHGNGYHRRWTCECSSCGKISSKRQSSLINNTCLCVCQYKQPRRISGIDVIKKQLYHQYLAGARKRNLSLELTIDQVWDLSQQNCFYCGASPTTRNFVRSRDNDNTEVYCNGIDRVDTNKSYTIHNVVTACPHCNIGKHTKNTEEFLAWIQRVYNHSVAKGFSGTK